MILLKPTGGLCNRLRAMDSGRLLSQRLNKPLQILWTLGPELNCSFYALFEPFAEVQVTESQAALPPQSAVAKKLKFLCDYLHYRQKHDCVIFQTRMNRLLVRNFDFMQLEKYGSVFITCYNRFYRPQRKFQPFEPVLQIRQKVETYTARFTPHTIGVHVRRTDHHSVVSYCPDRFFLDAMNAEVEKNPQTRFFLASDSPEVMSQFTAVFGDRILWHPKEYDRNAPQGIQDALVDLLCLSRTQRIIGSYMSSFSETAAQINDIPLKTIGSS